MSYKVEIQWNNGESEPEQVYVDTVQLQENCIKLIIDTKSATIIPYSSIQFINVTEEDEYE